MSELKGVKMEGSAVPAEKIKNPELCAAIEKLQEDGSKENIDRVVNEVVKAKLILPAKISPNTKAVTKNGQTRFEQTTEVQFRLIENQNKEQFFAIFTDTDEMLKWKGTENAGKIVADFDSVAQMISDPNSAAVGFVINPFGKSVTFPKNMIISIKQQRDFARIDKNNIKPGTKVQLGEPKEYPIDLMAALINHFSTEEAVNAAYLRMMMQEDGQKSYFIVVDFVGDMEKTFDAISRVAQPYLDDEIQLSMMPYSMEFARSAVKNVEPFYKKEM